MNIPVIFLFIVITDGARFELAALNMLNISNITP